MAGRNEAAVLERIEDMSTAFKNHIADDKIRFDSFDLQLGTMNTNMTTMNTTLEEIRDIMKAFTLGKKFVIGMGIFVGSLVAIVVGLKQIVGWLQ